MTKLSDYLANYLSEIGIEHIFVLQGGAALHLIDSIENHPLLKAIATQHEQASAMAADAYAKCNENIGVTVSTSGPGATNLVTGIACSYFDSIATLHITGNVASFRQSDTLNVRQYGFQETDIVNMVKPITKYAVRLKTPEDIITELPKAIHIAKSGRPGPVLIDIPDDFQRELINSNLSPLSAPLTDPHNCAIDDIQLQNLLQAITESERPLFIFGAGLKNQSSKNLAIELSKKLEIPYLSTWPLKGIEDNSAPLNLGSFGTHSFRGNNIVLQNADLIISVGSRLDSRATAKIDTFARKANIAMVDIDGSEIDKFGSLGLDINFYFNERTSSFLTRLKEQLTKQNFALKLSKWHKYIRQVRGEFNFIPKYELGLVDPYSAIKEITEDLHNNDIIAVDTGTCLPLTLVYGKEKKGQKYLSSYNNTPMGYALPASIGASLATGRHVTCICGDGGMQMNVQELATIDKLNIPITIFVFNNNGHAMIKQTQDDWMQSRHYAADTLNGLPAVNFSKLAEAYNIASIEINTMEQLKDAINRNNKNSPLLIEINIDSAFRYEPIIKYGNPLENMNPLLPIEKINKFMLVSTIIK